MYRVVSDIESLIELILLRVVKGLLTIKNQGINACFQFAHDLTYCLDLIRQQNKTNLHYNNKITQRRPVDGCLAPDLWVKLSFNLIINTQIKNTTVPQYHAST